MALVVDTCVLLDLRLGEPGHGQQAVACLIAHEAQGLLVCPVTLIELAPAFHGDAAAARLWLETLNICTTEPWTDADTLLAHQLWHDHVLRRRGGLAPKRPVADVMIGAFAVRFSGIITRNPRDFRVMSPSPFIIVP